MVFLLPNSILHSFTPPQQPKLPPESGKICLCHHRAELSTGFMSIQGFLISRGDQIKSNLMESRIPPRHSQRLVAGECRYEEGCLFDSVQKAGHHYGLFSFTGTGHFATKEDLQEHWYSNRQSQNGKYLVFEVWLLLECVLFWSKVYISVMPKLLWMWGLFLGLQKAQ